MSGSVSSEHVETVIVGAGQAGLAVGYYMAQRGRPFVILDANDRVGDPWRQRWESLRLISPARLEREAGRYVVTCDTHRLYADHVVVATGPYQRPRIPPFAAELDPSVLVGGVGRDAGHIAAHIDRRAR